jgi:two-component system, cell cycle sensor histidine kinase and response regulator CckA
VVMPHMGGRELADRLAATHPHVRVLFMSGYTDDAILHHGGLDRAASLIEKPFTAEALTNRIREALIADTMNAGVWAPTARPNVDNASST